MSRYRFALRPRWIASHLFVAALVVSFVFLGFWQLDRLQERKDRNARVRARTSEPVVAAADLGVGPDSAAGGASSLEFRRVTATGTYRPDQSVLVGSPTRDGAPGSWVLTPLQLTDGVSVLVNRGWIPNSGGLDAVPSDLPTPSGQVTVEGLVRATETRGSFGPKDPPDGRLTRLARADVERFDAQVPEDLYPFFIQLQDQDPPVAETEPKPVPQPELDEGPHLSYAFQWFFFASVGLVGYPLILRRRAREVEREARGAAQVPMA